MAKSKTARKVKMEKEVLHVCTRSSAVVLGKESLRTTALEMPKSNTEARGINEARKRYTPKTSLPRLFRMIEIEKKLVMSRYAYPAKLKPVFLMRLLFIDILFCGTDQKVLMQFCCGRNVFWPFVGTLETVIVSTLYYKLNSLALFGDLLDLTA